MKIVVNKVVLLGAFLSSLTLAPVINAAPAYHSCKVVDVMVAPGSRVHIRCDNGYPGNPSLVFFALPAASNDNILRANQVQSLGMAALAAGRPVLFTFDDADTSGTSFGCGANDCRRIIAVSMR